MVAISGLSEEDLDTLIAEAEDLYEIAALRAVDAAVRAFKIGPSGPLLADASLDDAAAASRAWEHQMDQLMVPVDNSYMGSASGLYASVGDMVLPTAAATYFTLPPIVNVHAQDYLAQATNRIRRYGDELWQSVRSELEAGFAAGESIDHLATRVRNVGQVSARRARTIARTEVISASNAGSDIAAQSMPPSVQPHSKQWLATHDGRTRPSHANAHNQTVAFNQPFTVGGWNMRYPGDHAAPAEEVINCRCTILYDVEEPACECAMAASAGFIAAGSHTGVVMVVRPSDPIALTVSGGLPSDEMHVTLGYYGDQADIDPQVLEALQAWAELNANVNIDATVGGVGRIGQDDPLASVMLLEAQELANLRTQLEEIALPDQTHPHFTPHVTLGYGVDLPEVSDLPGHVNLNRVELWVGDQRGAAILSATNVPVTGDRIGDCVCTRVGQSSTPAETARPTWSPTMTREQADAYTANSMLRGPRFHGTGQGADRIRQTGFSDDMVGTATGNYGQYGKGHYFTSNAQYAQTYAGSGEVLETRLLVTNPMPPDEFWSIVRSEGLTFSREGSTRIMAVAQERGYDGIRMMPNEKFPDFDEIVVFSREQIVVVTG